MIDEQEARRIAEDEARHAYHDLSIYDVSARLADGAWHIDYEMSDPQMLGGGPHFVIDESSGEVVSRRYEQ